MALSTTNDTITACRHTPTRGTVIGAVILDSQRIITIPPLIVLRQAIIPDRALRVAYAGRDDAERLNLQRGGSSLLACISAKALANIASVSITSQKPACISLMVDTMAGGPGRSRP